MDFKFILTIIILNFFHFIITAIMPIFNKEFFKFAPYPVSVTLLQVFLTIPLAFLIAWWNVGFKKSLNWLKIPKDLIGHLIFSSFSYGFMMAFGNIGLFVSNIDYAVLIRLSGLVWQGIFAFLFLGEKITLLNFLSMLIVMIGIVIMTTNFKKSNSQVSSIIQFLLQMITILFTSFSSISLKKVMNKAEGNNKKIELLTINFWRFLIALIPMFFLSIFYEPSSWINLKNIIDKKCLYYTLFGIFLGQSFQLIGLKLQTLTNVITLAVISQLKFLPTLILSHFLYNETKWNFNQIIGTIFVCLGAIFYSLTRLFENNKEKEIKNELLEINEEEEEKKNLI